MATSAAAEIAIPRPHPPADDADGLKKAVLTVLRQKEHACAPNLLNHFHENTLEEIMWALEALVDDGKARVATRRGDADSYNEYQTAYEPIR